MKRVLFIEAQIKRYRLPFYRRLHAALTHDGIKMRVVYSDPPGAEAGKQDNCDLPRDFGVKVRGYRLAWSRLLWQSALREIVAADLVIVDQANTFLINHLLLPLSLLRLKSVAFWGLGENLQADRSPVSEWYKKKTLNWVKWWFAYTRGTARYLESHGVPASKITAVQNSIDTRAIRACVRSLSPDAKAALRDRVGIPAAAAAGIFVGMLHKVKSLPFLIEASIRVRQTALDFHLIVAGGGPDELEIKRIAADKPWVHFVGPQFGKSKASLMAIADVFLLPGRAGLAVLDGLAAGLPIIATRLPIHGPEIEYLEHGSNGVLTDPNPAAYATAISAILSDKERLGALREGAAASGARYSIEAMVENFRSGILQCLAQPRRQLAHFKWRHQPGATQRSDG
jgi:glycosyltransferase involved in cell wall biosynthesis